MIGTIYALADPDTGNIRYCGKSVRNLNHRMNAHRKDARDGKRRHVYNWLRPIFASGREPEVIICEKIELSGLDRLEQLKRLNDAERLWIAQLKSLGFSLTNATTGGDGGHGRKMTPEHKAYLLSVSIGKPKSAETRARISAAKKGHPSHPSGPLNPCFGKTPNWKDPEVRKLNIRAAWSDPEKGIANGRHHLGEKNINAKITDKIAASIFLAEGTLIDVARKFDVGIMTVWNVRHRKTWRAATSNLIKKE